MLSHFDYFKVTLIRCHTALSFACHLLSDWIRSDCKEVPCYPICNERSLVATGSFATSRSVKNSVISLECARMFWVQPYISFQLRPAPTTTWRRRRRRILRFWTNCFEYNHRSCVHHYIEIICTSLPTYVERNYTLYADNIGCTSLHNYLERQRIARSFEMERFRSARSRT